MDFVIAGFGFGAFLLLLGLAARDLGPRLVPKVQASSSLSSDANAGSRKATLRRLVPLAGLTIMIGGAAVIAATFAGIFFQLADRAAGRLVLATSLGALLLVGIRLPLLARAKPKTERLSKPRRPAPPPRNRARPAKSRQSWSANGKAETSPSRENQRPAPLLRRQPARIEEPPEAPAVGSWGFPDLPNIFDSDEPIQTGLLERLLAEDPNWHQDGQEPTEKDDAAQGEPQPEESTEAATTSETVLPERPAES
ncbi:MAG: hypothetical protein ACJ789_10310 [Thermomicrobiales bacterium]